MSNSSIEAPSHGSETDPELAWLVSLVDGDETLAYAVTLTLSGQTVSGQLVSGARFFGGLADRYRDLPVDPAQPGDHEPVSTVIARSFDESVGDYRANSDDDEYVEPAFIHLADATVRHGQSVLPLPLWRGRLTSIVGWALDLPDAPL